jgi:hypothetical protein
MYPYFDVDGLSVNKLLSEWRWLCPGHFRLIAVSAFGELFLEDNVGAIHWLETAIARMSRVADTRDQFYEVIQRPEYRREWFGEDVALALAQQGFRPSNGFCVGYKTPIVFAESIGTVANVYIADLYEYVSFLGDLNFQIKDLPDGGKVRLVIGEKPKPTTET